MTDVIQQAREALDPKWTRPMQETVSLMHSALLAVVKAADAGHLIDTRRIAALGDTVCLTYEAGEPLPWELDREDGMARGATAGEVLAAAERETGL